jgi:hypothetical protein
MVCLTVALACLVELTKVAKARDLTSQDKGSPRIGALYTTCLALLSIFKKSDIYKHANKETLVFTHEYSNFGISPFLVFEIPAKK